MGTTMASEDKHPRRKVLASLGLGLAGVAGCGAKNNPQNNGSSAAKNRSTSSATSQTSEEQTKTQTNTSTSTTTTTQKKSQNIPAYPQKSDVPPLKAKPAKQAKNPVLIPEDIIDGQASFIADPFLFHDDDGSWHMFMEVMRYDLSPKRGVIGHATSDDGFSWKYQGTVLKEDYHLSFPCVFKWQGEYYVSPQSDGANLPAMYRAKSFPNKWERLGNIFQDLTPRSDINDHVFFRWDNMWWLFGTASNGNTYLYYNDSKSLSGSWKAHKQNPVIDSKKPALRLGGRPTVYKDHIFAYYQDVTKMYGDMIRGYRITKLTPSAFKQKEVSESPIVDGTAKDPSKATQKWNSQRMHTYDPWYLGDGKGWIASVDGQSIANDSWTVGIYQVPEQ